MILLCVCLWWLISIGSGYHDELQNILMTFNKFYACYSIAPDNYELETFYVSYHRPLDDNFYFIYFRDPVSYLRYRCMRHGFNKRKKTNKNLKMQQSFINAVTQDLEDYKKKVNNE